MGIVGLRNLASGTKAPKIPELFLARLKPCPFKAKGFQAKGFQAKGVQAKTGVRVRRRGSELYG